MARFKIGVAQIDYTPPVGLTLMGNSRQDYASRGIHDPLYSRAIVFAGKTGEKLAILSVDICLLDRHNVTFMRKLISSETNISPENILIAGTHTHSGPAPIQLGLLPKCEDDQIREFLSKASKAALLANKNLKETQLFVGYADESRVSFNRRLKCKDAKIHMNWEKVDPNFVVEVPAHIDSQIITVSMIQKGKPAAAMVNFGLHPAVLAGDNWLYSADFPGYLAEAMEGLCKKGFITAFFNGCCGNVNHIDYADKLQGRGYAMTQRIGYMLAVAAKKSMVNHTAVKGDVITVSRKMVPLKRCKITDQQRKWAQRVIEKSKKHPAPGQVDGLPDEYYAHIWLSMYDKQHETDYVEIMVIRVGDLAVAGLPGELFCELGMEIKKRSPARHTMVVELANDAIGYLPTRKAFKEGGYETSTGVTRYQRGAGEQIVEAAIDGLNELFAR
jgi:neutral ceramidase